MSLDDDLDDDYQEVPPVNGCARGVLLSALFTALIVVIFLAAMRLA